MQKNKSPRVNYYPNSSSTLSYYTPSMSLKRKNLTPKKKQIQTFHPKDDWNTYLTDADKYKVSQEEILKKKQLYVSKHNILSPAYEPPKVNPKIKLLARTTPSKDLKKALEESTFIETSAETKHSSLDLLELESNGSDEEVEHEKRPVRRSHTQQQKGESPIAKQSVAMKPTSARKKKVVSPSSPPLKFHSEKEKIPDHDLADMANEIRMLLSELQSYQEISGHKADFQTNELTELLPEDELNENLDQKKVIRFLVQLVCQTMTYLFKSEVDQQQLKTELHYLRSKYEEIQLNLMENPQNSVYTSQPSIVMRPPAPPASKQIFQSPYLDPAQLSTPPSNTNMSYLPSSMQVPQKSLLPERFIDQKNAQQEEDDDEEDNEEEEDGEEDEEDEEEAQDPVSKRLEEHFKQVESIIAQDRVPPSYQRPQMVESTPRNVSAFSGSSPTDLLFSPGLMEKFNQSPSNTTYPTLVPMPSSSTISNNNNNNHSNKFMIMPTPQSSSATNNKYSTPMPVYQPPSTNSANQHQNNTNSSLTRTADLLVRESSHHPNPSDPDDLSFDYDEMIKQYKQDLHLFTNTRDSAESTIERLSYHLSNSIHSKNTGLHPNLMASPVNMNNNQQNREQVSIITPNNEVPKPLQAPQHPFANTMKNTNNNDPVMNLFPEKRIYDATYGSF